MLADPVTVGELQEQRTVQAARCAVVDILDGGEMPRLAVRARSVSAVARSSARRQIWVVAASIRMG